MDSGGFSPHSCVYRRPLVAEEGKASNIWKSRENRAAPKALLSALGERLSQSGREGIGRNLIPDSWENLRLTALNGRVLTYDKVS